MSEWRSLTLVEEKVKAGLFPSAEALVNSAVEQFVANDDFEPGEMKRLLAVGEEDARQGRFVDGDEAFARLKARSEARRKAASGGIVLGVGLP